MNLLIVNITYNIDPRALMALKTLEGVKNFGV